MAIIFVDVSTYHVYAQGANTKGVLAWIILGIPNAFATLMFYQDGAEIPANSIFVNAGQPAYTVRYHYAQFADVLDLLRNEKPIKFAFNDQSLSGYITTGDEPVGEAEV
ncbi:MAG TPA: hypothetical protein VF092_02435 [Longimicrobium sp.]